MDNNSKDEIMKAMLDANQQREAENTRQQQEQRAQEEEHQRFRQVITEQRDQLVTTLGTVVDDFNQRSSSGQITISKHGDKVQYSLPFQKEPIVLKFLTVNPPLNLSKANRGLVPLAAYLEGYNDTGRNFLWCRSGSDDFQGKWIVCRITTRAALRPRLGRKPYGIVYGFENADELREIERSISMMHVYEVRLEDDVRKEFMQVLLDAVTIS